ncbi:hypothetical protein OOK12_43935 [Streptomyces sp. NBC_00452]|uniref:hypothetical protein n=1 Tax=Streptomyces sp. NBC_00452 TaxID=2975746 RepID=UPI00225AA31E|nr:hypothetical protein [Streptomyces sp. NBC_00452]MCX5063810.1 hypothetical protein [Streptomyces sp. NBC_00452]
MADERQPQPSRDSPNDVLADGQAPEPLPPRDGPSSDDAADTVTGAHATDTSAVQNVSTNYGTVVAVQNITDIQRLRGTPLPDEWIAARLHPYLPDDETTKAIGALLVAYRVAVIHAGAGTGRYTTALHALTSQGVRVIRQVRREPNEGVDLEGLRDEDTGWILDLRDEEETLRPGFGFHLREVEDHLRTMRSFVVVVTHTDTWAHVAAEAAERSHPLAPPDALRVLHAHLECRQPPISELDKWLTADEITQPLNHAAPAEAVRWALIVIAAVDLNDSTAEPKDFTELVGAVVQSAHNWRRTLRIWHTDNTDSAHRNYLLAAAALDGAPAATVYEAHTVLSEALDDTPQLTQGQHGPGIIELTHRIGAELGNDDRIRFLKPGYAEAVVDYFWVDRPHHVAAFTRWTAEQAATLPPGLGVPLAERVTQWVTRYTLAKQSFTVLRAVATHWAKSRHLQQHAQELLVAAAVDPSTGKRAREQYLTWAKALDTNELTHSRHTPVILKQVLAGALSQLGPAYPRIVLKRLSELAANTADTTVANAVGDALTDLWEQPALQNTIRATLTSWFTAAQSHHTAAARRAFLHLADRTTLDGTPLLLVRDASRPDAWALAGWRCALDDEANIRLQKAFDTWLDSALSHPHLQPAVLKTFTEAVFRSDADRTYLAPRFLVLNHAAYGWEPSRAAAQPTERTRLRDALVMALREADPTAPVRLHHAPDTA